MNNKTHQLLTNKQEIIAWLNYHDVKNYKLISNDECDNWKVDVNGHVDLSKKNLSHIMVQFGNVKGNFDCSYNQLTSLKGSPRLVEEGFFCQNNQLKNLKNAPRIIMNNFNCSMNFDLQYLNDGPNVVGRNYISKNTPIEILNNFHTVFHGEFSHCIWETNQQNLIEDFEDFYVETKKEQKWGKKLKMSLKKNEIDTVLLRNKMQKELIHQQEKHQYKL